MAAAVLHQCKTIFRMQVRGARGNPPRLRIIVVSLKSSSQRVFSRYIELFSTKRRPSRAWLQPQVVW